MTAPGWRAAIASHWPGIALAVAIAGLATLTERQIGGAVMLFALLFGMPLYGVAGSARFAPGIVFSAKRILRIGVALLGVRLTLGDVVSLGWSTLALVVAGIALLLTAGVGIARMFGMRRDFAVLSAGAVAICGASAALAIAAVLPQREASERQTILTVIGVTALSTIAMVVYPLFSGWLRLDDVTAGIFFGATIHDVAQVVAAGDIVSPLARDTATLVKLMRVACLIPVVALIAFWFRHETRDAESRPALPTFLLGFVALMLLNTIGWIPAALQAGLSFVSRLCLVVAVAALGARTSLPGLLAVGVRPVIAMILQTLLLAAFAVGVLLFQPV